MDDEDDSDDDDDGDGEDELKTSLKEHICEISDICVSNTPNNYQKTVPQIDRIDYPQI